MFVALACSGPNPAYRPTVDSEEAGDARAGPPPGNSETPADAVPTPRAADARQMGSEDAASPGTSGDGGAGIALTGDGPGGTAIDAAPEVEPAGADAPAEPTDVGEGSGSAPDASPPPPDAPLPEGSGLLGVYFDGVALENGNSGEIDQRRVDGTIDFDWGTGRPGSNVDDDWFSVRWTGQIMPLYSETYTFSTRTDEGVRLWVNGVQIVDHWENQQATTRSGTIPLTAYQMYDIRMEYFEATGAAMARLFWESPSQPQQIVPSSRLFPP